MTYKKILVPVDFSACANNALAYAIDFAKSNKSKIVLLHAVSVPMPIADVGMYIDADNYEEYQKISKEKIKELFEKFPQLEALTESHHAIVGFITDTILQQVEASECDLIIMGTHGATNTFDEFVGSNTRHIIKRANIPVLVVPNDYEGSKISKILFAFDYHPLGSKASITPLTDLQLSQGADLHVLHITDDLARLHEGAITEAKVLEQYLKATPHSYKMVANEHIEDGILDYIQSHDIDVVAVLPRSHNLLEQIFKSSISKQLVHHSTVPIFVFHEPN